MVAIHSTQSGSHDYLTKFYFRAIQQMLQAKGIPVKLIADLDQAVSDTVICDCDYLTPEQVNRLKNNGCKIVGFNMVDSSHLSQSCRENPLPIDLIFSLTGIQKTNAGKEFVIDKEFNVTLEDREFLPVEQWERFDQMRHEGRLLSLPYVHWDRQRDVERMSYDHRSPNVLIRGGAHFRRVVLALFLLRAGRLDSNSGFPLGDYFQPHMNSQFRFCDPCMTEYLRYQRYPYREPQERVHECTSPATWGDQLELQHTGNWNNRCPASFYWLSVKFQQRHGPIDTKQWENVMNCNHVDPWSALKMCGKSLFTSDFKWLHSIYAAQRFWDGAIGGAINLLPSRTADQEYFPKIEPGEHYLTFTEDFSCLSEEAQISKADYERISAQTFNLYNEWIRPGEYPINSKLLQWIIYRILS